MVDYRYLTSIWAIRLFSRHCDICIDFRVEIRAIYSSKVVIFISYHSLAPFLVFPHNA
jgi:hypothetical protein